MSSASTNWVAEYGTFKFTGRTQSEALKQLFAAMRTAGIQPSNDLKIYVYPEGQPRDTPRVAHVMSVISSGVAVD
jgi:hypothetical protein